MAPIRRSIPEDTDGFFGCVAWRVNPSSFNTLKTIKITLAVLVAIALTNLASAQTTIRITGSTAYRAAVLTSIQNLLAAGYVYGYSGSSFTGSSQAIFTGNLATGGNAVIIKTSFSGSIGGISTLAKNLTIGTGGTFTGGGGWLVDSTPQSTGGTPNAPADYDSPVTADIAMADCFQVSAPVKFQTPKLTDNLVGVVDFEWILTPGKAALGTINTTTNLTEALVADCLVNNTLKLSQLSGNSKDNEKVQGVGRDADSGTRIQALACSGIALTEQVHLKQYQPLFDGNTTPTQPPPSPGTQITGAALWPKEVLNTITYPVGSSGYSGGGALASAVKVSHSGSFPTYGAWMLSYLGINDAATVTDGIALEFAGVPFSTANVEGPGAPGFTAQYTYWGNEHLFYRKAFSGVGLTFAGQLAGNVTNVTADVSGVPYSSMNVHRESDGGDILSGGTP